MYDSRAAPQMQETLNGTRRLADVHAAYAGEARVVDDDDTGKWLAAPSERF
jgi:hypothetical protein